MQIGRGRGVGMSRNTTGSEAEMSRKKLTPWQKIIRAADNGKGTYLTPEECSCLGFDEAIRSRAEQDDFPEYEEESTMPKARFPKPPCLVKRENSA